MQASCDKELQNRWQTMDSQVRSHYTFRAEQLQSQYEAQRSKYLQYGGYRASEGDCSKSGPDNELEHGSKPDFYKLEAASPGINSSSPSGLASCDEADERPPEILSAQMVQLKPHVMKLMRADFDESFTESQAAVFYDEYFAGTQLRGTDPQDLDYMANFV